MRNLFILVFLISTSIHAQTQSGKARVLVIDKNTDTTELEKKYVVEKPAPSNFVVPDLNERDKFFEGIKFPDNWDDLKKDMFYIELKSKSKSVEDLIKKYPELKESDIKNLKGKMS